jgi:chromosome segregation ATPase
MSADLSTIRSNIDEVKGLIGKLNERLAESTAQLVAAKAEVETQTAALRDREVSLTRDLTEINAKLASKESEMVALQSKLDEASSKSNGELDSLREDLEKKSLAINEMEAEIAAISSLSGEIKTEMGKLLTTPVAAGGARRSRKLQKLLKQRSRQFGRKIRRSRK